MSNLNGKDAVKAGLVQALLGCDNSIKPINTMTFNIHRNEDASPATINQFIKVQFASALAANEVVVIALQEVLLRDVPQLSKDFNYEFRGLIAGNLVSPTGTGFTEYGDMIMSNHPIEAFVNEELTICTGQVEPRGLVGFLIQGVWYMNTHLSHVSAAVRQCQTTNIVNRLQALTTLGLDTSKTILMGDFNFQPAEASHGVLIADGFSDNGVDNTFNAVNPFKRIDYHFFKGVNHVSQVVLPNVLSDHRAVKAKFTQ